MKRLTGLVLSVLVLGTVAQAQAQTAQSLGFQSDAEMQNYLTISNVRVEATPMTATEITNFDAPAPAVPNALAGSLLDSLGPVLMDPSGVSGWIAFGKKAWDVVVANQPVVNVQTERVSVLPNDRNAWAQMANWRGPRSTSYSIIATNGFGIDVVKQTYTVAYNYGGSINGKGAYLANATVIPQDISVAWAYNLDSGVQVGQIVNTGSVDSPVPGVDLQVSWKVKTIIKHSQSTDSFFVKGDGGLSHTTL